MTDPILMNNINECNDLEDNDQFQASASVPVSKKSYNIQAPGPLLLDIQTRTAEEPVELDGIQDQPHERTKFRQVEYDPEQSGYLLPWSFQPELNEVEEPDYIEENNNNDREDEINDDYYNLPVIVYRDSIAYDNDGQDEISLDDNDSNDYINDNNYDETIFNRNERMDVKKPGPFFESSPNNFYLDKMEYKDDDDQVDDKDAGQQEFEMSMSAAAPTVPDKRRLPLEEQGAEPASAEQHKNYVHISLNNK
jgi:hypothetical protein